MGMNMGMEVFTIAGHDGGTWRKITNDPPYPAKRFQNALAVSGFMFWRLAERRLERELWGILHLSLDEEEFGITGLPHDWYSDNDFILDVLHGRDLCMTSSNSNQTVLTIWTLPIADEGLNTMWVLRYAIQFSGFCHTMALPPFSNGIILWQDDTIYCYEPATSKLKVLCEFSHMRYQGARKWKTSLASMSSPSRKVSFGSLTEDHENKQPAGKGCWLGWSAELTLRHAARVRAPAVGGTSLVSSAEGVIGREYHRESSVLSVLTQGLR
jgi:hypothetical protein